VKREDPNIDQLKEGARTFLYPRIFIGAALFVLFAVYIFWPR